LLRQQCAHCPVWHRVARHLLQSHQTTLRSWSRCDWRVQRTVCWRP
jgi:hypothetical protein